MSPYLGIYPYVLTSVCVVCFRLHYCPRHRTGTAWRRSQCRQVYARIVVLMARAAQGRGAVKIPRFNGEKNEVLNVFNEIPAFATTMTCAVFARFFTRAHNIRNLFHSPTGLLDSGSLKTFGEFPSTIYQEYFTIVTVRIGSGWTNTKNYD